MKRDKLLHFLAGFVVSLVVGLFLDDKVGFIAGTCAGLLKEVYDEWDYGGADFRDLFATIAGSLFGAAIVYGLTMGGYFG